MSPPPDVLLVARTDSGSPARHASHFHLFPKLPPEIKREIHAVAIHDLVERMIAGVRYGRVHGAFGKALYEYALVLDVDIIRRVVLPFVALSKEGLLSSFLRKAPLVPGIASAVVILDIDGNSMLQTFDWDAFVKARKQLRRLEQLLLRNLRMGNTDVDIVASNLIYFAIRGCQLTYSTLATAISAVPSFNARSNIIDGVDGHVATIFRRTFEQIELGAKSDEEGRAYALILSRVVSVGGLTVRGIEEGWVLGGAGMGLTVFACLYGSPRFFVIRPTLEKLFLGVTVSTLSSILPLLPPDCRARISLTIDVPLGCSLDAFIPMWRALHRCVVCGPVSVVFNIGGRKYDEAIGEYQSCVPSKLRKCNVINSVKLCPKASITVVRLQGIHFYRNQY